MHELVATVRAAHVEDALDMLLPLFPDGVHVLEAGPEASLHVLLPDGRTPDLGPLAALLSTPAEVREVSDDWRVRRRQRFRAPVYDGRLVVRPDWADPPAPGLLDVVLAEGWAAFGTGSHPTTRACLELLCRLAPGRSLADLGCGSGVLALAAAKLGWSEVHAVDVDARSVAATRANAAANGVALEVARADLTTADPPDVELTVANVPVFVHEALAGRLTSRTVVATGIEAVDRDRAVAAYELAGYTLVSVSDLLGWVLVVAERVR